MTKVRVAIGALALSAAGFAGIALQEGYSSQAIIPVPGDVPTIGLGSTRRDDGSPVKMGDTITPPQAIRRAVADIARDESAIRSCITVPLSQHEYDAFVSLAYNVGAGKFCKSTLVKLLNQGDYDGACKQILRWRYYQGADCSAPGNKRICGGLLARRQQESALCQGGA